MRLDPEGKAVSPLYLGLFHAHHPGIALVGIPWRVNPFPLFDHQASLVAAVASGRAILPDTEDRLAELHAWKAYIRDGLGLPDRFTHMLGGLQWDYCRALHDMANGETAGRAHDRWIALLRAGSERGAASSSGTPAAGSDSDWLATMPASRPRETAEVDVPVVGTGSDPAGESVSIADALSAMSDSASLTTADLPLSTWGGPSPQRLARDRAVYLNVSAARAIDATRYRKREYRFRGKPTADDDAAADDDDTAAAAAAAATAATAAAGRAPVAHRSSTAKGPPPRESSREAGGETAEACGSVPRRPGVSVRATIEVHDDFVVTAPVEAASEEALADSSSRLMATPF